MPYINRDEARILANCLDACKTDFSFMEQIDYSVSSYKLRPEYKDLSDNDIKNKIFKSLERLEDRLDSFSKDSRRRSKLGKAVSNDEWSDLMLRYACLRKDKKKRC